MNVRYWSMNGQGKHMFETNKGSRQALPSIILECGEEFEVEKILDSWLMHIKIYYLVSWKGYPLFETTWEPINHLCDAPDVVWDFHHHYPHKPAPPRIR